MSTSVCLRKISFVAYLNGSVLFCEDFESFQHLFVCFGRFVVCAVEVFFLQQAGNNIVKDAIHSHADKSFLSVKSVNNLLSFCSFHNINPFPAVLAAHSDQNLSCCVGSFFVPKKKNHCVFPDTFCSAKIDLSWKIEPYSDLVAHQSSP